MRAIILAALAAVSLSACADLAESTGVTVEQQQCAVASAATYAASHGEGWADLSYVQRGTVIDAGVGQVVEDCAITSDKVATVRAMLQTALIAASAVAE